MAREFYKQHNVWERYMNFEKAGMKESYLILYNGWLIMEGVLTEETHFNEFFLTNDFLEQ